MLRKLVAAGVGSALIAGGIVYTVVNRDHRVAPTPAQMQSWIVSKLPSFGISDVAQASCPTIPAWTPGATFSCFGYTSGHLEAGTIAVTVLRSSPKEWNINLYFTPVR